MSNCLVIVRVNSNLKNLIATMLTRKKLKYGINVSSCSIVLRANTDLKKLIATIITRKKIKFNEINGNYWRFS